MRIATFNLHHCAGRNGIVDVERTAAVIRDTSADVVALQELDRFMDRSGSVDQPAELARLLEMDVTFFPTLQREGGEYGIAIAARPPVVDTHYVPLPRIGDEEPRGAIRARWGRFAVVCTHLSRGARAREAQTAALAAIARGLDDPVVVLGDLNQTARTLDPFTRFGYRGAFGHRTLPRRFPRRQIDHILVSPQVEIVRSWTISTDASDHFPLIADLRLRQR